MILIGIAAIVAIIALLAPKSASAATDGDTPSATPPKGGFAGYMPFGKGPGGLLARPSNPIPEQTVNPILPPPANSSIPPVSNSPTNTALTASAPKFPVHAPYSPTGRGVRRV